MHLEIRAIEMIQNETEKNHRNKKSLSELWEAFRQLNINLIGVPDRVVMAEKIFEKAKCLSSLRNTIST